MFRRIKSLLLAIARVLDTLLSVQLPHASANGISPRRRL